MALIRESKRLILRLYVRRREWYLKHEEQLRSYTIHTRQQLQWIFDNPTITLKVRRIMAGIDILPYHNTQFENLYLYVLTRYDPSDTDPFIRIADEYCKAIENQERHLESTGMPNELTGIPMVITEKK